MSASREAAWRMAPMFMAEIGPYLKVHHPLKGAVFVRDWVGEALETEDDVWRWECLREAHKALAWLRRA